MWHGSAAVTRETWLQQQGRMAQRKEGRQTQVGQEAASQASGWQLRDVQQAGLQAGLHRD